MALYSVILENKWMLEVIYAFVISAICMTIVLKTDRFYNLSLHQGIRYFRNAFFFYGIAFIVRYIFGVFTDFAIDASVLRVLFEYFLVMAGFFLFYSLMWKKVESSGEKHISSLLNSKIAIFHVMALVISVFDFLWNTYYFMFFSQIIIFLFASAIAYTNYKNKGRQHKFLKFYFIAMILSFAAWGLNFLAASYFKWYPGILINIGIINVTFFLLFLYGIIKFTQRR